MIYLKKFITREFIKSHPDWYFVFGDNDMREGSGGQAKEMRGEPNSIGIRVKKAPGTHESAYYEDTPENFYKTMEDIDKVDLLLKLNKIVVFPKDGIGTGLAKLSQKAPVILRYILSTMENFKTEYKFKEIE